MENIIVDKDAKDYSGFSFELQNNQGYSTKIIFRKAKITPTKVGQFVTLWKRLAPKSAIQPFDCNDDFTYIMIMAEKTQDSGYFLFDKEILQKHGILSKDNKGGKRGFRVYPIWDKPNNKQAINTQKWQLPYFNLIIKK